MPEIKNSISQKIPRSHLEQQRCSLHEFLGAQRRMEEEYSPRGESQEEQAP